MSSRGEFAAAEWRPKSRVAAARRALDEAAQQPAVAAAELAEAAALAALQQLPEYALAASPFGLLDARGSLRLVTDAVHEDDALCLALACRALRDALRARFPACPRAGGRAVAKIAGRVTADGLLDLSYDYHEYDAVIRGDDADDGRSAWHPAWLRALPEGIGRLAYFSAPECVGLRELDLSQNVWLTALPEALCSLAELEELDLEGCRLRALPERIGALTRLRKLHLNFNTGLGALPEGLCSLAELEELNLYDCALRALPEGFGRLIGLRKLLLGSNIGLTALPVGLCTLVRLEELHLSSCGLTALPEEIEGLIGLKKLNLSCNEGLTALPAGLGRRRNPRRLHYRGEFELDLSDCPGLAALEDLQEQEGLPALLAHLAGEDVGAPVAA
jgi:hypothetical protein